MRRLYKTAHSIRTHGTYDSRFHSGLIKIKTIWFLVAASMTIDEFDLNGRSFPVVLTESPRTPNYDMANCTYLPGFPIHRFNSTLYRLKIDRQTPTENIYHFSNWYSTVYKSTGS